MKKRIAWITPDYFYDVDWPIVGRLKEFYDIRWYVLWGSESQREKPLNEDIYKIVNLKCRYRSFRIIKQYWYLIKDIKLFYPDVVYNAFLGIPFFLPMLFRFFDREKVIFEGHEIDPYVSAKHDWLSVAYAKYNLRNVGHVQVFSKHSINKFHKLYPGRECTYVPMVTKNYGEPSYIIEHLGKTVFLFFGGVRSTKRFDILLDAFLTLDENHSKRSELWVYGKCVGAEKEKYEKMIAGHTNIRTMFDFVPDHFVPVLFRSASYLVLPYQQITQSGPMMIAYNYDLPIIATDIEGFKERIIDGFNGYLFKRNNVNDLRRVLEICVDQTSVTYSQIKNNAKEFVEREYSIDSVIHKYRNMLDSFIGKIENK